MTYVGLMCFHFLLQSFGSSCAHCVRVCFVGVEEGVRGEGGGA